MTVKTISELLKALERDEPTIKIQGEAFERISMTTEQEWEQFTGYYYLKKKSNGAGIMGLLLDLAGSGTTAEEDKAIKLLSKWYPIAGKGNSYITVKHK